MEIAKDNASHILKVCFLSCSSCYKGLEDNKLTNLNKSHLTSLLCAFIVVDNMEQQSKIWSPGLGGPPF